MRIISACGFRKTAATTLEILYLQKEILSLGEEFKMILFDDADEDHITGVGRDKFMAPVKLLVALLKTDFDMVQIVKASPYVGLPGLIASKIRKKKSLVLLDDYERAITKKRHGAVAGAVMGLFEDMIIRSSDCVVCASEFLFERAKKLNKRAIFIPFGIPEDRFAKAKDIRSKLGLKKTDTVLVYVGSLTKDADADIAIKAMKKIKCKLLIVGGGEAEGSFKGLAESIGVGKDVIFCGWQEFEKVPDFIWSSDICLIPMRKIEIDMARCPMKLLEYMAAERPTVGGDVGMVSFFLRMGAGVLCAPDDPEDMGRRIEEIMPKARRAEARKKIKKIKEKYSWKNVGKRFLEAYEGTMR